MSKTLRRLRNKPSQEIDEVHISPSVINDLAALLPASEEKASCAHLTVSYRTGASDGLNVRGEVVAVPGVREWWECDFGCGVRFSPLPVAHAVGHDR